VSDASAVSVMTAHEAAPPEPTEDPGGALKGLPVAAVAVVFVIVAIATNWKWALTFAHVVGGGCGPGLTSLSV